MTCTNGTRPHDHIGKCDTCGKPLLRIEEWGNEVHDDGGVCDRGQS